MSWNHIESNWADLKSAVQKNWPSLTDEDINEINGSRDLLISTIQKKYFSSINDAEIEVEMWQSKQAENLKPEAESTDSKYNPDYSGADSNLTQLGKDISTTDEFTNQSNVDKSSSDHDEKSKDQT